MIAAHKGGAACRDDMACLSTLIVVLTFVACCGLCRGRESEAVACASLGYLYLIAYVLYGSTSPAEPFGFYYKYYYKYCCTVVVPYFLYDALL